jgi:hypothetical protein
MAGVLINVIGGGYHNKVFNDLHMFNFGKECTHNSCFQLNLNICYVMLITETSSWSRPADTGTVPVPRAGHSCCAIGPRLYTFGGGDSEEVFNDLHVLDTGTIFFAIQLFIHSVIPIHLVRVWMSI